MGLTHFPHGVSSFGVPLVGGGQGGMVQGAVYFVDNGLGQGSDAYEGTDKDNPLATIQAALDKITVNSGGATVYVLGSPSRNMWPGDSGSVTGVVGMSGHDLYGMYRENITIPCVADGLRLIGVNKPFITGNDGTTENTGETPTIQIGDVDSTGLYGPRNVLISGFNVGSWGDDSDDAADSNAYGVGIAIGSYTDTICDDVADIKIEDCWFRASNATGTTNAEDTHTHIKGWGNDRVYVRRCSFFHGQYAIGMMGSANNQASFWEVEDCNFIRQKTSCVMNSATPFFCLIKRCNFIPQSADTDLALSAGSGCCVADCSFPSCATAAQTTGIVTDPAIGTCAWDVVNGGGENGIICDSAIT